MRLFVWLGIVYASLAHAGGGDQTLWGEQVKVGSGYARSYVERNDSGDVKAIGYSFTEGALSGLPAQSASFLLPLPRGVLIPYRHITMDWNPHGHIPDHVYDVPHFDFHLYFLSWEARQKISCQGADRAACLRRPPADLIPPGYAPTPEGEPKMGWHWVDPSSHEFHGQPFTATFIYGYYDGKLAFVEPMVTIEFLRAKTRYSAGIARPALAPQFMQNTWGLGFMRGIYKVELRSR